MATRTTQDKIKSREALVSIVDDLKAKGKRIVFTNGCFDILHAGHVSFLADAKALADVLILGLNSDNSVRRLKGAGRPVVPEEERALVLASMESVDYVFVFDELLPNESIALLKPHIHVKGGDYRVEELPEAPVVRSYGGEIVILPLREGYSTTSIIHRIRQPDTPAPNSLSSLSSLSPASVVAIIPARYHSSRFPGKPLAEIEGKPMLQHVYERTRKAEQVKEVIIATDDERIKRAAESFGARVAMTSPSHPSGTDRIAEVAKRFPCDIVVNVQGDEPLIEPRVIHAAVQPLLEDANLEMSTVATPIRNLEDYLNPNVVKVAVDRQGFALYFSRSPLPYWRGERVGSTPELQFSLPPYGMALRHVGLYVYRRQFLLRYTTWQPTPLEELERLEQLRALENGVRIKVVETDYQPVGVDTPEDLEVVRRILHGQKQG